MLSIIIPTLNEENYLPLLLKSIKRQNRELGFLLYEVIIADGGSNDKTLEIAKNFGCQITKGNSPAQGRNEGAKIAQGDLLLFLDADIILPEKFFEKVLKEFKERNLGIATFFLQPHSNKKSQKFLFEIFYNFPIRLSEKIFAHASQAILIKKELFEKVGGFDEKIKFAEDHCFVRKAKKFGKFEIIKSVKILSSPRRFEKDGWLKTYFKYILAEIHMIFLGDIKREIFKYKFGNF